MEGLQNHASLVDPPPISWEELLSNGRVENRIFIFAVFSKNGDSDKKKFNIPRSNQLTNSKIHSPTSPPNNMLELLWNWYTKELSSAKNHEV